MKRFVTIIIGTFSFFIVKSQDIITLKTGEELNVKVVEVGISEIKYKKSETSPLYSAKKDDVFMIKYADGTKDVFTIARPDTAKVTPTHTDFEKGVRDAEIFYSPSGASSGTFVATIIGSGLVGLIPAIICSSTAPSEKNLSVPEDRKFMPQPYFDGYRMQARSIKKHKVWGAWGIGLAFNAAAIVVYSLVK